MYIQTDKDNNIIQLITVGCCPAENGYEIPDDTSEDILKNIFSYKYINGEFVFKDDTTNIKLQNVINAKLQFLSKTCNEQIEKGIDYNGSHYSLNSSDDQINLIQLGFDAKVSIITGQPLEEPLMYHADGEECREYTAEEILGLSSLAKKYKTYHTTFFNTIKSQINTMTNVDDIIAINYDTSFLDKTHLDKLTGIVGDLESLGFTLEVVEDNTNYNMIKNDLDIDSLVFQTNNTTEDPIIEETTEDTTKTTVEDDGQTTEDITSGQTV